MALAAPIDSPRLIPRVRKPRIHLGVRGFRISEEDQTMGERRSNCKRLCEAPGCDHPHLAKGFCRRHYNEAHPRKKRAETVTCVVCAAVYTRDYSGPSRQAKHLPTCSYECRAIVSYGWKEPLPDDHWARWYGATTRIAYTRCSYCNALVTHDPRQSSIYCEKHNKDSRPRFVSAQCVECGDWFIGDRHKYYSAGGGLPHCSDQCSARRNRRIGKERRRALKRDAYRANVPRRQVYEADGWRCHICGKKVKRRSQVPDPMAPTIDHVVPLAQGGTHEPANCRTAHFICNARKGDRGGGEQMILLAV